MPFVARHREFQEFTLHPFKIEARLRPPTISRKRPNRTGQRLTRRFGTGTGGTAATNGTVGNRTGPNQERGNLNFDVEKAKLQGETLSSNLLTEFGFVAKLGVMCNDILSWVFVIR